MYKESSLNKLVVTYQWPITIGPFEKKGFILQSVLFTVFKLRECPCDVSNTNSREAKGKGLWETLVTKNSPY